MTTENPKRQRNGPRDTSSIDPDEPTRPYSAVPPMPVAPMRPWPAGREEGRTGVSRPLPAETAAAGAAAVPAERNWRDRIRGYGQDRRILLGCTGLTAAALTACCLAGLLTGRIQAGVAGFLGLGLPEKYPPTGLMPTPARGATGVEACVVRPIFNQEPNGSFIVPVQAGHTEIGGFWWPNGNDRGLRWGDAEVGVRLEGGSSGKNYVINGAGGGALWDYSPGCSLAYKDHAQANYDSARRQVTRFFGDVSTVDLEGAGLLSEETVQKPQVALNGQLSAELRTRQQAAKEQPLLRRFAMAHF